jgi:hypothetical protein
MTKQRVVMLRAAWLSFALGTLVSLTLNAGLSGCSSTPTQAQAPSEVHPGIHSEPAPGEDPCAPRFMGATKAGVILPPGCERHDGPRGGGAENSQVAPPQAPPPQAP